MNKWTLVALVQLVGLVSQAQCLPLPSGVVAWWSGELGGKDMVGTNDMVLFDGANTTAGLVGKGFSFGGLNARAECVQRGGLKSLSSQITLEAWVYHYQLGNVIQRYVTHGPGKALIRYDGIAGPAGFHFAIQTATGHHALRPGILPKLNTWHHVVGTYDGSIQALYIDGELVAMQPLQGALYPKEDGLTVLGDLSPFTMNGLLDEVVIYDRGLSAEEVAQHFAASKGWFCNPRIAYIGGPLTNPNNGHDYYLLSPGSWSESEEQAIRLGGHLVTINDQLENLWVYANFGLYSGVSRLLWIGLNDREQEGVMKWTSGEPLTYTAWAPGEPNNFNGNEHFVSLIEPTGAQAGKWNDLHDTYTAYGVVEVAAPQLEIRVAAVEVSWNSLKDAIYQPQYANRENPANWINLGEPIRGIGGRMSFAGSTLIDPLQVYRVVQVRGPSN